MAENVERRMEKTVTQYEMLRSYGIMNDAEIKQIIKARENFTTLLERPNKDIKHYIEYITYERNLLKTITEKNNNTLPKSLETSLKSGIKIIYVQATTHFPNFIRIWDEYISFLTRLNFSNAEVMAVYEETLQFYGHLPEQWIKVIRWQRSVIEKEKNTIYKPCLDIIVRALRKHPDNAFLKFELIDLELINYGKQPSSIIEERCIKIYKDDKNILKFDNLVKLLELVSKYDETEEFQRCIMDDLKLNFANEELYWKVLAQRELNGQITYKNPGIPDNNKLMYSKKTRMMVFVKCYQTAIKCLKTKTIWSQYLDHLSELVVDDENLIRFKRKLLGEAYKDADESSKLEERHYLQYYKILIGCKADNDVIEKVLDRSIVMYPDSIELWKCKMSFYMSIEDVKKLSETFVLAKKRLIVKAYPLWSYYIGFLQIMDEKELILKTYEAVLKEHSPHFNALKADYLEYAAVFYGVKMARQIFKNSKNMMLSMEMYNKMLEIEENQIVANVEEWRGVLEHATNAFGKSEIGLWEKYVDFEMNYGDPIRASEIITRADKILDEKLATQFRLDRLLASGIKKQTS